MKVTNGEIMNCKGALEELVKVKLPVRSSLQAAKFANKVSEKLKAINEVYQGLIKTYGTKGEQGHIEIIGPNDEKRTKALVAAEKAESSEEKAKQLAIVKGREQSLTWEQFAKEVNELMAIEEEFVFEKIKLPEKVTGTCDACHHNMDVTLQIEPSILMALEKFVEVT